ncbi:MAG: hypothetical protein M3O28_12195 [Actinomycetota bacterium]|nr:hypothetical protein [Actinomycetota bacterium]
MTDTREARIAQVYRDLERMRAEDEAVRLAPRSLRRKTGSSIVFSVRLDPAEVAALEAKALVLGIRPTVLARSLIRTGLASGHGAEIADAVDRLEAAVCELRAAVG